MSIRQMMHASLSKKQALENCHYWAAMFKIGFDSIEIICSNVCIFFCLPGIGYSGRIPGMYAWLVWLCVCFGICFGKSKKSAIKILTRPAFTCLLLAAPKISFFYYRFGISFGELSSALFCPVCLFLSKLWISILASSCNSFLINRKKRNTEIIFHFIEWFITMVNRTSRQTLEIIATRTHRSNSFAIQTRLTSKKIYLESSSFPLLPPNTQALKYSSAFLSLDFLLFFAFSR